MSNLYADFITPLYESFSSRVGTANSAGVSGLTTALLLARAGVSEKRIYEIEVVAKCMPGDYDVEYCSPWAGADFVPTDYFDVRYADRLCARSCDVDSVQASYIRRTSPWFWDLAKGKKEAGKEAGSVKFLVDPWRKELYPDYRNLATAELPKAVARPAFSHPYSSTQQSPSPGCNPNASP
ncbi:hypothetical protein BKA65DRAFT_479527 [Rhexocercosporidium sp. MPI-PUGE-AT-0058]|nr:hypothetical protein BKA65DRAFT_479527 [Rhexocercosporidium sp. MPI-PUGE-AT-0058]